MEKTQATSAPGKFMDVQRSSAGTQPSGLTESPPRRSRVPALVWIGIAMMVVGTSPLLLVLWLSKDPNPNPVGPGILSFLTFWPGLGLVIAGVMRRLRRDKPVQE
jgi:hypothetical protein